MSNLYHWEIVTGETLTAPEAVALYRYWHLQRGRRPMPTRADIDPVAIPAILPWIYMIDVLPDPTGPRYRYRLIGTGICSTMGRDLTGRPITAEIYGGRVSAFVDTFGRLTTGQVPIGFTATAFFRPEQDWQRIAGILLPLSTDGRIVDIIIGTFRPTPLPAAINGSQRLAPRTIRLNLSPRLDDQATIERNYRQL